MALVEFGYDPQWRRFCVWGKCCALGDMLPSFLFFFLLPVDCVLAITWPSHFRIEYFQFFGKLDLKKNTFP